MSPREIKLITRTMLEAATKHNCLMSEVVDEIFGDDMPDGQYHTYAEKVVGAIVEHDFQVPWKFLNKEEERIQISCTNDACMICNGFHEKLLANNLLIPYDQSAKSIRENINEDVLAAFNDLINETLEGSFNAGMDIQKDGTLDEQVDAVIHQLPTTEDERGIFNGYDLDFHAILIKFPKDLLRQMIIEHLKVS